MKRGKLANEQGAVSIFVVVFSALFVTIITVSFVGLMIRGQQQALNADLSNSAYDAALAGVEDAKRMLLRYRQCVTTNSNTAECTSLRNMMANPACNMVKRAATNFADNSDTEMLIKSSDGSDSSSQALDQAYTCVTVAYTSDNKEMELRDGESVLIPIDSAGQSYNKINISWFTNIDNEPNVNLPDGSTTQLPTKAQWMNVGGNTTRPPILRAQWIQHGDTFNAADFDSDKTENFKTVANTKSLFLYPNSAVTSIVGGFATDNRSATVQSTKAPAQVYCNAGLYTDGQYICSIDLDLPDPINNQGARTGYLQLAAIYNSTKVKVSLKSNNDPVTIVAPTVDSTGRANDLFRRVKVGISFTSEYPRANFDVTGNICKDFSVSDTPDGFDPGTNCDPNNP